MQIVICLSHLFSQKFHSRFGSGDRRFRFASLTDVNCLENKSIKFVHVENCVIACAMRLYACSEVRPTPWQS